MSDFANVIKTIRQARGMTQEQFAVLLNTSKQNISRYENGEVTPKITTAERIANILGISLTELNGGDDSESSGLDSDVIMADRQAARVNPDRRVLLDLARNGSDREVHQIAALVGALRSTNPEYYDGDDPA